MYTNTLPQYIILDTRTMVEVLRSRVKYFINFDADEYRIFLLVFESIINEKEAQIELEYSSMAITSECIGKIYEADVELILNAVIKFGIQMHCMLINLHAYQNGKLPYTFVKCIGGDILLERNGWGL